MSNTKTEELRKEAMFLREQKHSYERIGKKLKISAAYAYLLVNPDRAKKYLETKQKKTSREVFPNSELQKKTPKKVFPNSELTQQVLQLRASGLTYKEIAEKLNIYKSKVYKLGNPASSSQSAKDSYFRRKMRNFTVLSELPKDEQYSAYVFGTRALEQNDP